MTNTLTKIRIREQLIELESLIDTLDMSDDDKELLSSEILEIYTTSQKIKE